MTPPGTLPEALAQIRASLLAMVAAGQGHCGYTGWAGDIGRLLAGPVAQAEALAALQAQPGAPASEGPHAA